MLRLRNGNRSAPGWLSPHADTQNQYAHGVIEGGLIRTVMLPALAATAFTVALMFLLAIVVLSAHAEEMSLLKNTNEPEQVENTRTACCSPNSISTNSPFVTCKSWDAEANKMVKVFGAQNSESDGNVITDCLKQNYGGRADRLHADYPHV